MYRQIDSVAMGSPLGAIPTNPFLCHFEKHWVFEWASNILLKV